MEHFDQTCCSLGNYKHSYNDWLEETQLLSTNIFLQRVRLNKIQLFIWQIIVKLARYLLTSVGSKPVDTNLYLETQSSKFHKISSLYIYIYLPNKCHVALWKWALNFTSLRDTQDAFEQNWSKTVSYCATSWTNTYTKFPSDEGKIMEL